ncbi:MAG: tetratricopeptide repeat protein [Deltaproteobacteria bacterium]|nr:tetratricopeptide repeat protein [Deltaproteobacteria bacterium]
MRRLIIYPFLAILAFLVYSNTFFSPFVFDDGMYITGNAEIRELSNFWPPSGTRYLGYLSFALNYRFGGLRVFGYHLINVIIHAINGLLVYGLVSSVFKTPWLEVAGLKDKGAIAFGAAFLSSAVFIAHPIETQAVTYTTQRFASLATLFYLLSIVLYLKWRSGEGGIRSLPIYALALVSTISAQMTKEISFTLPFLIALYELTFFSGPYRKRLLCLVPFLLTLLIIPLTVLSQEGGPGTVNFVSESIREKQLLELSTLSPYEYFSTEMRVIVTYLRLLILPVDQNLDYGYPYFNSIFAPEAFASLLFLILVLSASFYVFIRARRKDPFLALIPLGIFWFFITLSIESSVIPIRDVIFEHRLYLPSIGAITAFSAAAIYSLDRIKKAFLLKPSLTALAIVLAAVVATPLGSAAYLRNEVWRDDILLWKDVIKKSPLRARPHSNLGDVYYRKGRIDEAIDEFERAAAFNPDATALLNLGNAYFSKGLFADALAVYRASIEKKPASSDAHYNLALTYENLGMDGAAIIEFETAVMYKRDRWDAHYKLGLAYRRQGRVSEAREEFETALAIKPDLTQAYEGIKSLDR